MKKTAREFLKENGALFKYYRNMILQQKYLRFLPIKHFLSIEFNRDAILSAFYWSKTPEGHTFWEKLNDKWLENLQQ